VAKFSERRLAKVTFSSVRENGVSGSVMVFKLCSNIVSRIPMGVTKRSVGLFEYRTIALEITNPFDKAANFSIKLYLDYNPISIDDVIKENVKGKSGNPALQKKLQQMDFGDDDVEIENLFKKPFWTVDDKMVLEALGTRSVTLHFLPFVVGQHVCQVVLSEAKAGEVTDCSD
jgi:hypothetical protein